jgi:hypothetical protein
MKWSRCLVSIVVDGNHHVVSLLPSRSPNSKSMIHFITICHSSRAEEVILREDDVRRDLDFLCHRVVDTVDISKFIPHQKSYHGLLVQFLSTRFLIDVTVDLASPLSNAPNCRLVAGPGFRGGLPIKGAGWKSISDVASGKDSFPP